MPSSSARAVVGDGGSSPGSGAAASATIRRSVTFLTIGRGSNGHKGDMAEHLAEGVTLHAGDCREVLRELAENSFDSCVTDPPYGLTFMGRDWDRGVPGIGYWKHVLRVLKPGAHLLSFGGTRTYHRMACAIEDAGFEIRDAIMWHYGSGFPKSRNVSKAIDEEAGAVREVVGFDAHKAERFKAGLASQNNGWDRPWMHENDAIERRGSITAPATPAARQWSGWGTALKPATEIIVLARKPLSEPTIAANVLRWGTGAINVDGCRIACNDKTPFPVGANSPDGSIKTGLHNKTRSDDNSINGRWPANVAHDGSEEVIAGFPDARSYCANSKTAEAASNRNFDASSNAGREIYGAFTTEFNRGTMYADSGSAARFFYTAKADADDRLGSKHPTIKPVDLMQWLVRLVTPRGGTVLDCFAGTGTTGEAAIREGMRAVLIEREPEYQEDIRRRMRLALAGPDERARESIKARGLANDPGPLFANGRGAT